MFLPQLKEREYRFRLALRIGLPIFSMVAILLYTTFASSQETLGVLFYFFSILILVFTIYFILFLIYNGFDTIITDKISHTFTREYITALLQKELNKDRDYTIALVSIDNIQDINDNYGFKNTDEVVEKISLWINEYLSEQKIGIVPMGTIKHGDFLLGFKGSFDDTESILNMMCLKISSKKVKEIEISVSGYLTDSCYSNKLDYLVEKLYEIKKNSCALKVCTDVNKESINPNELEMIVINAIKNRSIVINIQDIYENSKIVMKECSIKLIGSDEKIVHQKEYLKVINRLGFEVEFDLIILEEILSLHVENSNIIYAYNISPRSLRNYTFKNRAKELLATFSKEKSKIMFILSENEYYAQSKKFNLILQEFRELGVMITLDRLGALHTTFLYLKDLDVDAVRFDKYYTKTTNHNDIVDGLMQIAKNKGLKTWFKLISNRELLDNAKALHVDYMQGYFLETTDNKKD